MIRLRGNMTIDFKGLQITKREVIDNAGISIGLCIDFLENFGF